MPESYCPDIHERLVLYKRLASCETHSQINEIHEELVDRFGLPEMPVTVLLESHRIRLTAKDLGIDMIDASAAAITFTFSKNTRVEPMRLITLMQREKNWKMTGAEKLRVEMANDDVNARIDAVKRVLQMFQAA